MSFIFFLYKDSSRAFINSFVISLLSYFGNIISISFDIKMFLNLFFFGVLSFFSSKKSTCDEKLLSLSVFSFEFVLIVSLLLLEYCGVHDIIKKR